MPINVYICLIKLNTPSTFPSMGHSPKEISNYKWSDGYKDDIQKDEEYGAEDREAGLEFQISSACHFTSLAIWCLSKIFLCYSWKTDIKQPIFSTYINVK